MDKLENDLGDSKLAMAHLQQTFNETVSVKDNAERLSILNQKNFRKAIFSKFVKLKLI